MLLRSADVLLRGFEPSLSETLYGIRNHPSVRRFMRNAEPIARDSHERWVQENLLAERRVHLFLVCSGAAPVGIALLRNFSGKAAEVGLMMVEAQRRRMTLPTIARAASSWYGRSALSRPRAGACMTPAALTRTPSAAPAPARLSR